MQRKRDWSRTERLRRSSPNKAASLNFSKKQQATTGKREEAYFLVSPTLV
jgi:hypothetical protein